MLVGVAAAATILVATLVPSSAGDSGTVRWCVLCGELGVSDAIANLILFVPLAVALACSGVSSRRAVVMGLLLSGMVELTQLRVLPGREAALGDVVWNTLGTALGVALVRWLPGRRRSGPRAAVAAVAVLAVLAGAGLAQHPDFPPSAYYGQWTANLGMYEWYRARVLSADIGGLPLPSWRLADSRTVRERLLAGAPLSVRAVAGPRTGELAPLFSIFDAAQREILLVGPDRDDLVLKLRTRAADLRLRQPDLRWRGALAGVAAGDTLVVELRREGRAYCLRVGAARRCGLAHTAGRSWGLVKFFPHLPGSSQVVLDWVFMALLGLLVGLLMRRGPWGYAAVLLALAGAVALPPAVGLAATPVPQLAALAVGLVVGALAP